LLLSIALVGPEDAEGSEFQMLMIGVVERGVRIDEDSPNPGFDFWRRLESIGRDLVNQNAPAWAARIRSDLSASK